MTDLRESWHFVNMRDVPVFRGTTSLREAYGELARRERGGFLVEEASGEKRYVRARMLAEEVLKEAGGDQDQLGKLMDTSLARAVKWEAGKVAALMVQRIRVAAKSTPEKDLREQADTVFEVEDDGTLIGLYLNHKTVRETLTRKTIWVCKNGHENTDFGSGGCAYCPATFRAIELALE